MSKQVYIVGAGPGNKDLLTLKAYKIITEKAEVVIYDRLISDDIIDLINPDAEKIFAGKEPDRHHMTQDQINDVMVKKAKEGKTVLRLKGGDPFIFGRGGEETEILKEHDIEYEAIPGITAASAASAQVSLPLTYRKISDGVIFISGHAYDNNPPDLDWRFLADTKNTIVLYMGMGNIDIIAEKLMEYGKDSNTPCAVIQNAGLKNSDSITTCLSDIYDDIKVASLSNPAIIIIGEVVNKSLSSS